MPDYLLVLHAILIIVLPASIVLAWPRADRSIIVPVLLGLAMGYFAFFHLTWTTINLHSHELELRQARGELLTHEEMLYDGVGQYVGAMFAGWIPTMMAIGVTLPFKLVPRSRTKNDK